MGRAGANEVGPHCAASRGRASVTDRLGPVRSPAGRWHDPSMEWTRLLLVRHGETAWNADGRVQGHLDIALNDVGRTQARRLAEKLRDEGERIDLIYSSDLARARQTAQAVADAAGVPLQITPALRERCFGAFEGRRFADVQAELPQDAERWRRRDPHWTPPGGGESLLDRKSTRL